MAKRAVQPKAVKAARPRTREVAAFMKGEQSPVFAGWRPQLRDASDEVQFSWVAAASRAIDAIHNSGWLAGAVDQSVALVNGTALDLVAKPDAASLGWTDEEVSAWRKIVETRWEAWSTSPIECDLAGRQTIGQMSACALRTWYATGEAIAVLPWRARVGAVSKTKVQLIPSHRLVQTTMPFERLVQGVRMDGDGMPIAYRFSVQDRFSGEREIERPARDRFGRPIVIHVFDGAPGQVRGITPLVPVLKVVRQYDQLQDATLTAALIQAIFAATLESDAPTQDLLAALQDEGEQGATKQGVQGPSIDGWLSARGGWYDETKIDLGIHGKIAHLFPGEKLKFNRSEHPNSTYEAFSKFLLREIARCLGMTVETLTGDYSDATYSSVRMSTSETWPVILYRRATIVGRFLQQIYGAWLEEEIDAGRIPFKGGVEAFIAQRGIATRAAWRGPPRPTADELKAAKANEINLRMRVTTRSAIAAENGEDVEDIDEQEAREAANRVRLGLPPIVLDKAGSAASDGAEEDGEQPASTKKKQKAA